MNHVKTARRIEQAQAEIINLTPQRSAEDTEALQRAKSNLRKAKTDATKAKWQTEINRLSQPLAITGKVRRIISRRRSLIKKLYKRLTRATRKAS